MSEANHRNPFEDHINSRDFDVSHLETGIAQKSPMQQEVDAFITALLEDEHLTCERHLDNEQQEMSYCITEGLTQDILRKYYADDVQDLGDEELRSVVRTSVTLAMLANERLVKAKRVEDVAPPPEPYGYPENPSWDDVRLFVINIFEGIKNFFQRLFRRY